MSPTTNSAPGDCARKLGGAHAGHANRRPVSSPNWRRGRKVRQVHLARPTAPANELAALLALIVREDGGRPTDGEPPTEHDISWAWHQTTNLRRALNALSTGGGWRDRSYGLTPTGR